MSQFMNLSISRLSLTVIAAACLLLAAPVTGAAEELDKQMVQKELELLKQRIADLERLLKQQHPEQAVAAQPAEQMQEKENKASKVANFSEEEPSKEKGQVEISTAGSTMTVGGQIRLDTAYNSPSSTSNFGMGTSAIPSPAAALGERGHLSAQVQNSRFWFKTNTPINGDALRTLIEIDFYGSAGNERVSNSHNIRLRHAYAEYDGFTIGQTNSTFMHSGTTPDLINDSTSDVLVRQQLIRYTSTLNRGVIQLPHLQP